MDYMEKLCHEPLWNNSISWDTINPNLSKCFRHSILLWLPYLFLLICSFAEVITAIKNGNSWKTRKSVLKSRLFQSRIALIIILLLSVAAEAAATAAAVASYKMQSLTPMDYSYFLLYLMMLLINCGTVYIEKCVTNKSSSSFQFPFWLFLAFCLIPTAKIAVESLKYSSNYNNSSSNNNSSNNSSRNRNNISSSSDGAATVVTATLQLLQIACCLIMAILELFPYHTGENSEQSASFASRITFSWLNPMFKLGFNTKVSLDSSQYPQPRNDAKLEEIITHFNLHWNEERKRSKKVNIVPILARVYGPSLLKSMGMMVMLGILVFLLPQVLRQFVKEVSKYSNNNNSSNNNNNSNNNYFIWKSYFLAGLLSLVAVCQVSIGNIYYHHVYCIGMRMRTAMFSTIYEKSLNLSPAAKGKFTVGEKTNYISVDCQRFYSVVQYINYIWAGPLQIMVASFCLYDLVGVSAFAGLSVLLLCIPINVFSMKYAQRMEQKLLKAKDKRVHVLNEAILGIRALKLYAWEIPFLKKLVAIREMEVGYLKKCGIFWANMNLSYAIAPILVTFVTFATYVFLNPQENILTAEKVFACMTLFNIIRMPMYMMPLAIMDFIKFVISIKRINEFLSCPEIKPGVISAELDDESNAIEFHNATLSWNKEEDSCSNTSNNTSNINNTSNNSSNSNNTRSNNTSSNNTSNNTLTNINLHLKKGSLTAVLGTVGSGKSSLLSGLLGEMELEKGRICRDAKIAYVSQQAWIQNQSLKDNILFGREFRQAKYSNCLKSCALLTDLSILPAGDMTEIGENGINLSGGQKQRVSLARATYGDEDIVLLDDPLSAVDAHVAEHLFFNCIGPKGILAGKTRVLVTHNLSFLEQMDRIILLENGQIVADGTHTKLSKTNNKYKLFIKSMEMMTKEEEEKKIQEPVKDRRESIKHQTKSEEEEFKLVEKEMTSTSRVDIRHFVHLIKKANVYICLFIATMTILSASCNTYGTMLLSGWTDRMSSGLLFNLDDFMHFLKLFGIMIALQSLFCYLDGILHFRRCAHAAGLIHNSALESIFHSPMAFFDSNPTGRVINRFSSDMEMLDQKIPKELTDVWYCLVNTLVLFSLTTYLIPLALAFFLPMAVLGGLLQVYYARTKRQMQRIESVSKSPIFSFFSESVQGANVIRAFGAQNRFVTENQNKIGLHLHTSYINMVGARWLSIRVDYLSCFVILVVVMIANSSSSLSAGIVSLLVCYSVTLIDVMAYGIRTFSDLESDSVALERLSEYDSLPGEGEWFSNNKGMDDMKCMWPADGSISFVDYSTRYREDLEDVIKNLSLDIKSEEKIGICGRTGAGKSSLTMALFRITEASRGSIIIAGRDISTLGLQELRSQITVVPQDPVLFSGTLRFNLDPTDSYEDYDILSSLKHVHLDLNLTQEVTEGGKNFSVGQRQLICLARALLRKTKILVLDEATAAMDAGTDQLIQATIAKEFKHCTVLTVAHRLHTILNSDRIVVMDKGEMVECGEPQLLLQQPQSYFYKLCMDAGIM